MGQPQIDMEMRSSGATMVRSVCHFGAITSLLPSLFPDMIPRVFLLLRLLAC